MYYNIETRIDRKMCESSLTNIFLKTRTRCTANKRPIPYLSAIRTNQPVDRYIISVPLPWVIADPRCLVNTSSCLTLSLLETQQITARPSVRVCYYALISITFIPNCHKGKYLWGEFVQKIGQGGRVWHPHAGEQWLMSADSLPPSVDDAGSVC